MLEICCCTFEYVDAMDVVGTTEASVVVCSGYVVVIRGEDEEFWSPKNIVKSPHNHLKLASSR